MWKNAVSFARAGVVALSLALVGAPAMADPRVLARGFDAVPFKPTTTSGGLVLVEGVSTPSRGTLRASLLLDSNVGLLALRRGSTTVDQLLPWRNDLMLAGSYQWQSWLEVAAVVPVTAYQTRHFDRLEGLGLSLDPRVSASGLGTSRLTARASLPRSGPGSLGVADVLEVRLPTGDADSFLGERGVAIADRVVFEKRFGGARLLGNAGFILRESPGRFLNLYVGNELTAGLGVEVGLALPGLPRNLRLGVEAVGSTPMSDPLHLYSSDAARKSPVQALLSVRAEVWRDWEATLGVGRGLSADGGYGHEAFRLVLGLTAVKRLGDGVVSTALPGAAARSAPSPAAARAGQLLGLRPYLPRAPAQPDAFPCARTRGVRRRVAPRSKTSPSGCTGSSSSRRTRSSFGNRPLPFLTRSTGSSASTPSVGTVVVEGHTDDRGTREHNQKLSEERARAVVDYLVDKGLPSDRLSSRGLGFDQPVAMNETATGRAQNRRTEFLFSGELAPCAALHPKASGCHAAVPTPNPLDDVLPSVPDLRR